MLHVAFKEFIRIYGNFWDCFQFCSEHPLEGQMGEGLRRHGENTRIGFDHSVGGSFA